MLKSMKEADIPQFIEPEVSLLTSQQPSTCHILTKLIQFTSLPLYFFQIHFTIFLPPMPSSSNWYLSYRFHYQYPVCFFFAQMCHMPCLFHHPWIHHQNNICSKVQIMKLIMQFSPVSCCFLPLMPKHLLQQPILIHP